MLKVKRRRHALKTIIGMVVIFIFSIMAFIQFAPQFGSKPSGKHLEEIKSSPNYRETEFVNQTHTKLDYSLSNIWGMLKDAVSAKNTSPKSAIQTNFNGEGLTPSGKPTITWFGHSAILLEISGKRIFLDPMLGSAASPLPFFAQRFENKPTFDINTLDPVDAVVFSHDHYDHLDYWSVKKLKDRVGHFYTPLGVGSHLIRWGVDPEKITELDWWDSVDLDSIKLISTPARHFSGRSIGDSNSTLWSSWVIQSNEYNIYFSGDSGYGPHFKEIGKQYGPFDLAMMECGQYNKRWESIHMLPDQTVQATRDLKGKLMMPIHWGAFSLAPHAWNEPAELVTSHANESGVNVITPRVGSTFSIHEPASNRWWEKPVAVASEGN